LINLFGDRLPFVVRKGRLRQKCECLVEDEYLHLGLGLFFFSPSLSLREQFAQSIIE